MLFDRPAELPVATLRSRSWSAVGTRLRGHVVARWRWLKPRTVPVIVALAGMLALLASTNYLSNLALYTPERSVPVQLASEAPAPGFLNIHVSPPPATITIDGKPIAVHAIQLPSSDHPIKLVPAR